MPLYLLCPYLPDGPVDPSVDYQQLALDLARLAERLRDAGAWFFAGHLAHPKRAVVVRVRDGELAVTPGAYLEDEHITGTVIVKAPNRDAALVWAGELAAITGLPVELRPYAGDQDAPA